MLNRREFIGAACGVALASRATALPSDQFRWAMSSHMFTPLKPHPGAGIKVAARFGFHGIEPWGNELRVYLTQPPEVFKKVLDEAGIGISSVASGGEYFDYVEAAGDARQPRREREIRRRISASRRSRPTSAAVSARRISAPRNGRILARNLNEVGKRTLEHGVKFAFHPHAWTIVERKAEVDMILEMTDPKLVFLTLDTCHASVGGIEPVTFARDALLAHRAFPLQRHAAGLERRKRMERSGAKQEEEAAMAKKLGLPPVAGPDLSAARDRRRGLPRSDPRPRERHYDGWISLDFNYVDMLPGVTIEQDMAAHRKYLVETLHASLTPMK